MSERPWIIARPAYSDPDPKYPRPKYLSIGDVWALHPHLALKFASESEAKAYARGLPGAPSTITGQLLEEPTETLKTLPAVLIG